MTIPLTRRGLQQPTHVASVITSVLRVVSPQSQFTIDATVWGEIAGAALAVHSRPARWQNGCLLVAVDHSGHLFTLHLQQQRLLQRLQERFGRAVVRRLDFALAGAV